MKTIYPAVFTPADDIGYTVYVPDLQINTQGDSLAQAIDAARDAICLVCIDMQDDKKTLPEPSMNPEHGEQDLVSLIDVDLDAYRKSIERHIVRRNVSLPAWLDTAAKEANINVSSILVNALKSELKLSGY